MVSGNTFSIFHVVYHRVMSGVLWWNTYELHGSCEAYNGLAHIFRHEHL